MVTLAEDPTYLALDGRNLRGQQDLLLSIRRGQSWETVPSGREAERVLWPRIHLPEQWSVSNRANSAKRDGIEVQSLSVGVYRRDLQ
jgi:hypothetical protein